MRNLEVVGVEVLGSSFRFVDGDAKVAIDVVAEGYELVLHLVEVVPHYHVDQDLDRNTEVVQLVVEVGLVGVAALLGVYLVQVTFEVGRDEAGYQVGSKRARRWIHFGALVAVDQVQVGVEPLGFECWKEVLAGGFVVVPVGGEEGADEEEEQDVIGVEEATAADELEAVAVGAVEPVAGPVVAVPVELVVAAAELAVAVELEPVELEPAAVEPAAELVADLRRCPLQVFLGHR